MSRLAGDGISSVTAPNASVPDSIARKPALQIGVALSTRPY
ncbi:hypothetical protein ACCD10_21860 [Pseudomonas sp. Pseusp122]